MGPPRTICQDCSAAPRHSVLADRARVPGRAAALARRGLLPGQFLGQRQQRVGRAVHHGLRDLGDAQADLATLLSRSNACRGRSRCRSASTPMACSTRTRAASACSSCATVTASRAASSSSVTGVDLRGPAGGGAGAPRSAASRSASTIALVRSAACSSPTCQPCSDRRTTTPSADASTLWPGVVSPLTSLTCLLACSRLVRDKDLWPERSVESAQPDGFTRPWRRAAP